MIVLGLLASMGILLDPLRLFTASIISYTANFLIYSILGHLTPFFGRIKPLGWILQKLDMFVMIVPKDIFPFDVYYLLPGYYTIYIPIRFAMTGMLSPSLLLFLIVALTIYILTRYLFLRHLEVWGG